MITIPTAADKIAEVYGLRTALNVGEKYADAPDIFLHGRDYYCPMPKSPQMTAAPDHSEFVRTYRLWADGKYEDLKDQNKITGRSTFVSAERLNLFMMSLIGYPYTSTEV